MTATVNANIFFCQAQIDESKISQATKDMAGRIRPLLTIEEDGFIKRTDDAILNAACEGTDVTPDEVRRTAVFLTTFNAAAPLATGDVATEFWSKPENQKRVDKVNADLFLCKGMRTLGTHHLSKSVPNGDMENPGFKIVHGSTIQKFELKGTGPSAPDFNKIKKHNMACVNEIFVETEILR